MSGEERDWVSNRWVYLPLENFVPFSDEPLSISGLNV